MRTQPQILLCQLYTKSINHRTGVRIQAGISTNAHGMMNVRENVRTMSLSHLPRSASNSTKRRMCITQAKAMFRESPRDDDTLSVLFNRKLGFYLASKMSSFS